jgi:hypothetical protein
MIQSIYQIDFIDAVSGGSTRLLSIGEKVEAVLGFGFEQESSAWSPVGLDYGFGIGLGGARQAVEWQRMQEHASHATAAAYAIKHPASIPKQKDGKLRVTISGGEVWDFSAAVILAVNSRLRVGNAYRTLTGYRCECGEAVPVSGLAHVAGVRIDWILETHSGMGAKLHSGA